MPISSFGAANSIIKSGVVTSTTRPASPYDGQVIYETDTDRVAVYDSSAWVYKTNAGAPALTLIKTQTIGSGVSSVTVNDVFSSTYNNYHISVSGGVTSTATGMRMTLGSTTTGYYSSGLYVAYNSSSVVGFNTSNGSFYPFGYAGTNVITGATYLQNPFASKETVFHSLIAETNTVGLTVLRNGFLNNTTSYTAFTIAPDSGTFTGGTIRVYGYANS